MERRGKRYTNHGEGDVNLWFGEDEVNTGDDKEDKITSTGSVQVIPDVVPDPTLLSRGDWVMDVMETDDNLSRTSSVPSLVSEGSTEEDILYGRLSAAEITAASDETWGIGGLDHFLRTPRYWESYADPQQRETEADVANNFGFGSPEESSPQRFGRSEVMDHPRQPTVSFMSNTECISPEEKLDGRTGQVFGSFRSCRTRMPTPANYYDEEPSVSFRSPVECISPEENLSRRTGQVDGSFRSCRTRMPTPVNYYEGEPSVSFRSPAECISPEENLDGSNDSSFDSFRSCRKRCPTPALLFHVKPPVSFMSPADCISPEENFDGRHDSSFESFRSCRTRMPTPADYYEYEPSVSFKSPTEFISPEERLDGRQDSSFESFRNCRTRMPTPIPYDEYEPSVSFKSPAECISPADGDGRNDSSFESFRSCRTRSPTPVHNYKPSVSFMRLIEYIPPQDTYDGLNTSSYESFRSCRTRKPTPARTYHRSITSHEMEPWRTVTGQGTRTTQVPQPLRARKIGDAPHQRRQGRWPVYRDRVRGDTTFYIGFFTATLVVLVGVAAIVFSILNNKFHPPPPPPKL